MVCVWYCVCVCVCPAALSGPHPHPSRRRMKRNCRSCPTPSLTQPCPAAQCPQRSVPQLPYQNRGRPLKVQSTILASKAAELHTALKVDKLRTHVIFDISQCFLALNGAAFYDELACRLFVGTGFYYCNCDKWLPPLRCLVAVSAYLFI